MAYPHRNTVLRCCRIDVVNTIAHIPIMSKTHTASSAATKGAPVAKPNPGEDAKGSINLRIDAHSRRIIDEAATLLGKTRTEFMIESARRQATDVLLDQRLFVLDTGRYEAFMDALDNPPPPGPKLKALLRRVPAWEK